MNGKPWWASKTLWVNLVALAASVAAGFGFDISGEAQTSLVAGVMALVNIGLRLITSEPIRKGA